MCATLTNMITHHLKYFLPRRISMTKIQAILLGCFTALYFGCKSAADSELMKKKKSGGTEVVTEAGSTDSAATQDLHAELLRFQGKFSFSQNNQTCEVNFGVNKSEPGRPYTSYSLVFYGGGSCISSTYQNLTNPINCGQETDKITCIELTEVNRGKIKFSSPEGFADKSMALQISGKTFQLSRIEGDETSSTDEKELFEKLRGLQGTYTYAINNKKCNFILALNKNEPGKGTSFTAILTGEPSCKSAIYQPLISPRDCTKSEGGESRQSCIELTSGASHEKLKFNFIVSSAPSMVLQINYSTYQLLRAKAN
jgi:hypothetical protein